MFTTSNEKNCAEGQSQTENEVFKELLFKFLLQPISTAEKKTDARDNLPSYNKTLNAKNERRRVTSKE